MYGWLEIHGELKSFNARYPFHAFVHVFGAVPDEMVVDYFQHYLDAGTREQCETHPMLGSIPNVACAALTYRYLRPHGRMLEQYRTNLLDEVPPQLGPKLFADDLLEVWAPPGGSVTPASVLGE